jgi:hypothetical protein
VCPWPDRAAWPHATSLSSPPRVEPWALFNRPNECRGETQIPRKVSPGMGRVWAVPPAPGPAQPSVSRVVPAPRGTPRGFIRLDVDQIGGAMHVSGLDVGVGGPGGPGSAGRPSDATGFAAVAR